MITLEKLKKANKLRITNSQIPNYDKIIYVERDKKTRKWDCSDNEWQSGETPFADDDLMYEMLDEYHLKVEVED